MHKLVLLFARQRGQDEMKEIMLNSKARLSAFYISLFEKLNKQFLTGQSMQAFIDFYEEKQNIIESLMESCSDPKTCDVAFGVLTKAEIFLDSLFWCETFSKFTITQLKKLRRLERACSTVSYWCRWHSAK